MKYKLCFEEKGKLKTIILESSSIENLKTLNGYPLNIIKIKKIKPFKIDSLVVFKNDKEVLELFYEMSTMLEAKLPIKDVIEILLNTQFSPRLQDILYSMQNAIKNGQPIYKVLKNYQNYLGYLPILFFKLGEKNSNFSTSISALYKILNESYTIKQKINKAMSYPLILVVALFVSVGIIFNFIVPKFAYIFAQLGDNLPLSTYILLQIKEFIDNYYIFIIFFLFLSIIGIFTLYKNHKYYFDKIFILYIPYFSSMYRYMIFYKLFLTISLIVRSKFQFQDAMDSARNISNNLFVKRNLENIIRDINSGMSISRSFEKTNLFDKVAIRLLLTAQKTNQMERILEDIQRIYKKRLSSNIEKFTIFLEPLLILIISSIVLWLVLAIMTPVWELSSVIG